MKRYSKILLCAVLTTALLFSFVVPSSAVSYQFDVSKMFTSGNNYVGVLQYGSSGMSGKEFAVSNYTEKRYAGMSFYQSSLPCWRESYGSGYNNYGEGYAHVTMSLNVPDSVLEDLNGGILNGFDLYYYMYIESGVSDVRYPMLDCFFQIDNRDGTYRDFHPNIYSVTDVKDALGINQDLYHLRITDIQDFKISASAEVKFILTWQGLPEKGAYLTFGFGTSSYIDITPVSHIQQGIIDSNNNKLDDLQNQVGGIVDDLDSPKPGDNSVNEALDGIDIGSAQSIGSLIGINSHSTGGFYRFVLTVCLSSLGVAFIGYVLHGKRG